MKCSSPLPLLLSALLLHLLLLLSHAPIAAEAVTCNPLQLSSCAGAIISSAPPSPTCCANLKQQTPCFCQYMRNPSLRGYITSPNAKRVATTCGVPFPRC